MTNEVISQLRELHRGHTDIDQFLSAVISTLKQNNIDQDEFSEIYDKLPEDDFKNDLLQAVADDWDFWA